jgi:hypothetical protein
MNFLTIVQQLPPEAIQFHWKLLDKIYGMFFHNRKLEELYVSPPLPEELLTPDQEIDMVLAETPVFAKQGQDHKTHIQVLEQFFQNTDLALSEASFGIIKALIMSHYELLQQELMQMQAEQTMQALQMEQAASGGANDKRKPNASPFTQEASAPTGTSLTQDVSGSIA